MLKTKQELSASNTIIKAGLLAGTLDIFCALLHYYLNTGKNPVNVLKFIASGVFGKAAFSGGTVMASAGLLFHYIIVFLWTIFFFLIYPRISLLAKTSIGTGLIYGIFIWVVMNFAVLPISATPKLSFTILNAFIGISIIMLAVGLPISIIVSKYYRENIYNK